MTAIKYLFALVGISLLMVSCAGEMEIPVSESHEYPVSITADGITKVAVNGTSVIWETTDKMNVTAVAADKSSATAELSLFEIDESDPRKASFSGFVTMPAGEPVDCYFTYPTGSAMEVDPNTGRISVVYTSQNGSHVPFMYARTSYDLSGVTAAMKHVGSVLEITMSESMAADVKQISFVGNALESLSPIIVNPSDNTITTPTEAVHQITAKVNSSGKIYLSVPPVNLSKGFTLICSNEDGSRNMFKSFSSDGTISGGYDFSAKRGTIIPVMIDGTFENFDISCSEPAISHTTKDGLLNGTSVTFVMNKQGVSNKLIEEWGAVLSYDDGEKEIEVRKSSFSNTTPISGQVVTMGVENDWKLIPGGTYIFAPYYKVYGKKYSLPTKILTVADPGVKITIDGSTSYDAFLASGANVANTYSNTEIRDVAASINVHTDIIDSYTATLDGTELSATGTSGSKKTFGKLTRSVFKQYPMKVSVKCGAHTFEGIRNFEITGLPMVGDFTTAAPGGLSPAWLAISTSYETNRVKYNDAGASAVRSPAFHIPSDQIKVKTACDCRHNYTTGLWKKTAKDMYISACSSSQRTAITSGTTLSITTDYYQSVTDVSNFASKGYLYCGTTFSLTDAKPCLIYSVNITNSYLSGNLVISFRHKIEYAN